LLKRAFAWFLLGVGLASAPAAFAVTLPASFVADNAVTSGTLDTPVGVAFLPDGRFLVAEKRGRVWMVKNGVRGITPVWAREDEVLDNGDRGLLHVAVDPNYFVNHYIYMLYTVDPDTNGVDDNDDAFGRLTRYTMSGADSNVVDPASRTILMGATWSQGPPSGSPSHTIGTLRFASDGSLIVSVGDGASFSDTDAGGLDPGLFGTGKTSTQEDIGAFRAQYTGSLSGKILRINPANGQGYPSNPYWDGNASSVPSRVWAYGFRNPYRFNIRPGTGGTTPSSGNPGTLYVGDVGWGSWEECNVVAPGGGNYGWPCYEGQGGSAYTSANPSHHGCNTIGTSTNPGPLKFPVMMWNHTSQFANGSIPSGLVGNASIGGVFYTGTSYPTAYRNNYFFGDFGESWIKVAVLNASNQLMQVLDFGLDAEGPVDFTTDPVTGDVYYVSITTNQVRRLRYTGAGANQIPVAAASGSPNSGPLPLTVSFSSAGSSDPDGDPLTYEWQFGDGQSGSGPGPQHTYSVTGTYTAVLSVNDGRGGVASAGVTIFAGTPPVSFPNTPVLDNFNRANGAIGGSWVGSTGGLVISSNQLKQTGGDASPVWNGAVFGADQEAYIRLTTLTSSSPEHDLLLKIQGQTWDTGHIEVRYDATQSVVMVSTYTPGIGWLTRGTTGLTFSPGDVFGARARSNGSVEVFRNGFLVFTTSVSGWPYVANGGRIGLSLSGAVLSSLDDFGGGTVGGAPPGNTPPHASLISPSDGQFYYVGQNVSLSGSGSDAEDSDTSLAYRWIVDLHHNNHVHPGFFNFTGKTATLVGMNHDDGTGVYLTVKFVVTDRGGLADTARCNIYPEIDLEPSPITVTPATPSNPGTTQYAFTINNRGRMPAPISRWRLVAGATLVAEGDTLVGALDSVRVTRSLSSPFAGAYDLRVVVDTLGTVTETNEANNARTQPLQVTGVSGYPTTGVLDNFNRANGALGGSWVSTSGVAISSNQLAPTSGSSSPIWNGAVFGADQEAFVTLSVITASSPEHDLLLKVQGTSATSALIEVRYDAVQRVVMVSTYTPGTGWRTWGVSPTVTFVAGDQLGARVRAGGAVEIYRNGGLL
jgi:glucose/arabinose dehydrogenase